jgi:hypothetical protein
VQEGEVFNILVWIFKIDAGHVIAMSRMSVVITLWDVLGSFIVEVNLKIIQSVSSDSSRFVNNLTVKNGHYRLGVVNPHWVYGENIPVQYNEVGQFTQTYAAKVCLASGGDR